MDSKIGDAGSDTSKALLFAVGTVDVSAERADALHRSGQTGEHRLKSLTISGPRLFSSANPATPAAEARKEAEIGWVG
jgi:hypothetical protein